MPPLYPDIDIPDDDTILSKDGTRVTITPQLEQLARIARWYDPEDGLDYRDEAFIKGFGRNLVAVSGLNAPTDLIDRLASAQDISPAFAVTLRDVWGSIVDRWT
jgi:hypothetical protein